jgi:hypothetical protein
MIRLYKRDAELVVQDLALLSEFRRDPSPGSYEEIRTWTPPGISVDQSEVSNQGRGRLLVLERFNSVIAAIREQSADAAAPES